MNAPMANAAILVRTTLMPAAAGGALVGPYREHRRPESARAQLRHTDRDRDQHHQHHEAEAEARILGARPHGPIETEDRRSG